jgi:hypothetical protein
VPDHRKPVAGDNACKESIHMSDTANNGEACPTDLPEQPGNGASEDSPTIHVDTKTGSEVRVDTSGPRPTR